MKVLVFAVFLAVMQAAPPVPGKAANNAAHATTNIKAQSKPSQTPSLPSPATAETNSNRPTKTDSSQESQKYREYPVVISKLPAVALDAPKRDWADWGTWGFNLLLVAVGGLQVALLCWTLRVIRRQAKEMIRQRILMRKQWGEMSQQTASLKEYVDETKKIAKSSVDSANIAARVSIPTLVIEKFETGGTGAANLEAMLQYPKVKVVIKNYGQTPAFLRSWTIVFTCEELPPVPDYKDHPASGIVLERDAFHD